VLSKFKTETNLFSGCTTTKSNNALFLVSFFSLEGQNNFSVFMSQDLRFDWMRDKDISRTATEGTEQENYEGFEGMNYEQVRQPYNLNHKGRNSTDEQRNDGNRPDEC
jgi:hypothetical protein